MSILTITRPIILATASEARRKLVADLGLKVISTSVEVDESQQPGEPIDAYVTRVASEKSEAVTPPSLDALIITVDTAVGLHGEVIGKPRDEAHAREILSVLSGKTHEVVTAIVLRDVQEATSEVQVTRTQVTFIEIGKQALDWYLGTGEWQHRAGAYAIQGKGAALVASVEGCLTNVIGLSLPAFVEMLGQVRS